MSSRSTLSRKPLGLIAVAIALAVIGVLFSGGPEAAPAPALEVDQLSIDLPARAKTTDSFEIAVAGADPGENVEVLVDAGYDRRKFSAVAGDKSTTITVPPMTYAGSGVTLVTAHSGRKVGRASLEIDPGVAVSPLDLYLGPRTVIADADHFSMLVSVPKDNLGNPVSNGTSVSYLVTRPSEATEESARETEGLLSHLVVYSSTVTGRTRLAAESGTATGPERSFLEVAGVPSSFTIEPVDPLPPADGSALVRLRSDRLTDEFDNELPDGTAVFLDASGATGIRRLRTVTIDAVAEFVLEVPDQPGSVTIVANASGTMSEPNTLQFASAVDELPIETSAHEDGTLVSIGRVISARQNYVPDGTVATLSIGDDVYEVPLELGQAEVVVPQTQGQVTVDVLGTSESEPLQ